MSEATWELPSGKDAGGENFPVASLLVRRALRPHLQVFYAYCRAIDDVADAAHVDADERCRRLLAFDAVLAGTLDEGPAKAQALRASSAATGVSLVHARELIQAFLWDTSKSRYADWNELMAYCRLSASPVGRHVLELHGEAPSTWPASDALCSALQVINHLQDCGDDYRAMDRVYIPEPWLEAAGLDVGVLGGRASPPALRAVLDRLLDGTTALLRTSAPLSRQVRDGRLALEIGAIQRLAERLVRELRQRDPLAERVKLRRATMLAVALRGAVDIGWSRLWAH